MGYPMAKNLRAGLGPDKTLVICDVNPQAIESFRSEVGSKEVVEVTSNGYEAAMMAVSSSTLIPATPGC